MQISARDAPGIGNVLRPRDSRTTGRFETAMTLPNSAAAPADRFVRWPAPAICDSSLSFGDRGTRLGSSWHKVNSTERNRREKIRATTRMLTGPKAGSPSIHATICRLLLDYHPIVNKRTDRLLPWPGSNPALSQYCDRTTDSTSFGRNKAVSSHRRPARAP